MNAHDELFGLYRPGDSIFDRMPVGGKIGLVFAVSLIPLIARSLWFSLALLVVVAVLVKLTGRRVRETWGVPLAMIILVGLLFVVQFFWGSWTDGLLASANLVLCLYASRILTLTTPAPVLLDGLTLVATPLKFIGLRPERVGLAAALMIRSIPYLFGSLSDVRDAAKARGLERNVLAQVAPLVVNAVAYAQTTGEALAARGLGDDEDD